MKDYYKTLDVPKTASKDELKKAFYKIAHENHPDKNKNNPAATQKFKEASEAYAILSDEAKRKQYDAFGSAGPGGAGFNGAGGFQGGFNPQGGFSGFNGAGFDFSQFQQGGGFHFTTNGGDGVEFDLGDLFGDFFGGGGRGRRPRKGANITVDLRIPFKEAVFGTEKEISIGGRSEKLSIKIPPGIESGQGLRIAGKGEEGQINQNGDKGAPGDLIVRIWVDEHPLFRKEGFNLVMELPVKLTMALTGGSVEIDTLDGVIELKIPQGTSHGEILRVKGKGVPYETAGLMSNRSRRGDLLIVTHVLMPKKLSREAQRLIDELKREGI